MIHPMLASLEDAPLDDPHLVYEPKYDGIRAIAEVSGGRVMVQGTGARTVTRPPYVRLWSRLGNEKTGQFPEIVSALQEWARRLKEPVVLDGEIVALDAWGEPTGFQQLQGRIHLTGDVGRRVAQVAVRGTGAGTVTRPPGPDAPDSRPRVAFIAFDLLRNGRRD